MSCTDDDTSIGAVAPRRLDRHRRLARELHHEPHRERALQLVEQLRVDPGDVDPLRLELLHQLGIVGDAGADRGQVDLAASRRTASRRTTACA